MTKLIILGSSNAIPDHEHENTHLALVQEDENRLVMVDCATNPILRLQQAGLDLETLTDLILTHFHPDHVSGVPLLLMNMWLLGRKRPLNLHGLAYTLDRVKKLMTFYEWETWPNFYPVNFHRIPDTEMAPVLNDGDFRIYASPVCHLIPTIGLRFEIGNHGKVVAYSCDTEPCPAVINLAAGANLLIHESAGATPGHSSASQAGEIAQSAQAESMYLIHYPTRNSDPRKLVAEAQGTFSGRVQLAEDFMEINLG